jgi:hypothetical protein
MNGTRLRYWHSPYLLALSRPDVFLSLMEPAPAFGSRRRN